MSGRLASAHMAVVDRLRFPFGLFIVFGLSMKIFNQRASIIGAGSNSRTWRHGVTCVGCRLTGRQTGRQSRGRRLKKLSNALIGQILCSFGSSWCHNYLVSSLIYWHHFESCANSKLCRPQKSGVDTI